MKTDLTSGMKWCGIKVLDEKTRLLPIYFHSVGHFPNQKYVVRPDGISHYQLAICLSGKGVFSAEGKEYDIGKGDMFFFSPSIAHEYYPQENNWAIIWVVFGGKEIKNLFKYFSLDRVFVKTFDDEQLLQKAVGLCNDLFYEYNRNENYSFELTVTMLKLLHCVSGCRNLNSRFHGEKASDRNGSFSVVIEYIKKYYYNFLTLDSMAAVAEMSKSHFCREFKKVYGMTPVAYLNTYRISVAKFLLATTEESIEIISGKTGFAKTSYFCAVFRKHEGCSPKQFRERQKAYYGTGAE